ncbi:MAG: sulfite exporter TauE/SafE family protein [Dehalococcoidales bacterium]|nr:sulfite exporter TauE/SafE family protein [Dehalococcoidales bacterium]
MSILSLFLLLVIGVLTGVFGGLLGIGGGAIMLPVMRFGFDFSPAMAVGTTLTAVIFTAAAGAYQHWRLGNVDWKSVRYIALAGIIGVIAGSILFYYISNYNDIIDLIVGLAFFPIALGMAYEGIFRKRKPEYPGYTMQGSFAVKAGIGTGVGFFTGMIGIGGGYILVPAFIYILKSPVCIAIGSSMASFVWFAIIGSGIKIAQGFCDIPAAIALGLGVAGGAIFGARLVSRFKPATLKLIFGVIFTYVSLKYILIYFGITI